MLVLYYSLSRHVKCKYCLYSEVRNHTKTIVQNNFNDDYDEVHDENYVAYIE